MNFEKQIAELQRQIDELRKHASASKPDLRLPWTKSDAGNLYDADGSMVCSVYAHDPADCDYILTACNNYERLVKVVKFVVAYHGPLDYCRNTACEAAGIDEGICDEIADYAASLLRDCGEEVPE